MIDHASPDLLQEDDAACQSAPASPSRRTPRPPGPSTVTKVTSELFSTDSDISRSLELVYKEPREEDQRRKLSARYRHNSSCSTANSDGSIASDKSHTTPAPPKLEKRKPSVTQLRQRSKSRSRSPQSQSRAESRGGASASSRPSTETSTHSAETEPPYDLQHQPSKPLTATTSHEVDKKTQVADVAEQVTLPSEKAQPSPTKVTKPSPPSISSLKEQSSDEIITPSLKVECHKPDQTAQPAATAAVESCQAKSLDKAGKVSHGKSSP